ncbi:MAG: diguanylate cyclase [Spirochaetes bacterium]|nr:diguanylate cyclase [Spirochaetota bacterium]
MGLLEKALRYKSRMNSGGKRTIMDRIAGPADTGAPLPVGEAPGVAEADSGIDVLYLKPEDLVAVDDEGRPLVHEEPGTGPPPGGTGRGETSEGRAPRFTGLDPEEDTFDESKLLSERRADVTGNGLLDYMALHELSKDILGADSREDLFEVILFTVMGQIGVSSSSIMVRGDERHDEWQIAESRGVTINRDEIDFHPRSGILRELLERKKILDVEEFREGATPGDDYYTYIAIDARLLVPIVWKDEVLGALVLGNKLTSEEYPDEEKEFLRVIAEYAAFAYHALVLKVMNETGSGPGSHIAAADRVRGKISHEGQVARIRDIVQEEFRELGIAGYGMFTIGVSGRDFDIFVADPDDRLQLMGTRFRIASGSGFIQEISRAETPILFNDLRRSKTLVEVFSDRQLGDMSVLDLFTFKLGGELLGFIMVHEFSETANLDTVHARLLKFVDFIFPYIHIAREIEYARGNYIDTISRVYARLDDELANARELRIPVTVVLFTIKNFKRYHAMFGRERTKAMFEHFESFISSRISDRDFTVRYDRHKMLLVLPGKDRKYATPLGNAICAEMTRTYSTREVQLLMTFLSAEYPVDGSDSCALVDALN